MNRIVTWFLMLMYGLPTIALLIVDACQGFTRIKTQPVATLCLEGFGFLVVLFGSWILRSDKKEYLVREQLREKLGGEIITVTLDFEDSCQRFKWNIPTDKVNKFYQAINSLKLNEN